MSPRVDTTPVSGPAESEKGTTESVELAKILGGLGGGALFCGAGALATNAYILHQSPSNGIVLFSAACFTIAFAAVGGLVAVLMRRSPKLRAGR